MLFLLLFLLFLLLLLVFLSLLLLLPTLNSLYLPSIIPGSWPQGRMNGMRANHPNRLDYSQGNTSHDKLFLAHC